MRVWINNFGAHYFFKFWDSYERKAGKLLGLLRTRGTAQKEVSLVWCFHLLKIMYSFLQIPRQAQTRICKPELPNEVTVKHWLWSSGIFLDNACHNSNKHNWRSMTLQPTLFPWLNRVDSCFILSSFLLSLPESTIILGEWEPPTSSCSLVRWYVS